MEFINDWFFSAICICVNIGQFNSFPGICCFIAERLLAELNIKQSVNKHIVAADRELVQNTRVAHCSQTQDDLSGRGVCSGEAVEPSPCLFPIDRSAKEEGVATTVTGSKAGRKVNWILTSRTLKDGCGTLPRAQRYTEQSRSLPRLGNAP